MAYASKVAPQHRNPGSIQVLNNAITTGSTASTHFQYSVGQAYSNWAFQVVTGTTKADKLHLQGSLDGTNFTNIAGSTWVYSASNPSGATIWVTGKAAVHVRAVFATKATTSGVDAYVAPA